MLTAPERKLRASIAGLTRAAMYDGLAVTAKAREAGGRRFLDQVIAEAAARGEQPSQPELERRAQALRRAHMQRMAFLSVKARTKRARDKTP